MTTREESDKSDGMKAMKHDELPQNEWDTRRRGILGSSGWHWGNALVFLCTPVVRSKSPEMVW